ncbi:hypothetical protein [Cryptosporangium aurantiacum]|uniref:Uncharacterized protein n=1 Tax=Cryptosporangium aurantiacum TaxID=134849 RepID=A0A1M7Q979_9ACTN|nr:hypothetical protein [Cryptosporangium aurantiacum]SHN26841.1 hypothetical protein SAMN05443668_104308 [Cryptosporangium aurantiacum]
MGGRTTSVAPRTAPVLYSARTGQGLRQIIGDLIAVGLVWWAVRLQGWVDEQVSKLAAPGEQLASAGNGFSGGLSSAGRQVGRIPGVGDDLKEPFDRAAGAGQQVAEAGQSLHDTIERTATVLGLLAAAVPLIVVLWWVLRRSRWVREATAARRLVRGGADASFFALRALAHQPLTEVIRVARRLEVDPGEAWRSGHTEAVEALAALELKRLGVR